MYVVQAKNSPNRFAIFQLHNCAQDNNYESNNGTMTTAFYRLHCFFLSSTSKSRSENGNALNIYLDWCLLITNNYDYSCFQKRSSGNEQYLINYCFVDDACKLDALRFILSSLR